MHHYRAPDHRCLVICERDVVVHILQFRLAGSVCFHISHVAHMPLDRVWTGVRFAGWIKMSARGTGIARAAIAEFMNMKAMIAGSPARYLCLTLNAIGNPGKRDRAAPFVASSGMKHRNCL